MGETIVLCNCVWGEGGDSGSSSRIMMFARCPGLLLLGDGTSPAARLSTPNLGETHLVFLRKQLSGPIISNINSVEK